MTAVRRFVIGMVITVGAVVPELWRDIQGVTRGRATRRR